MESRIGEIAVHWVGRGSGTPVIVLHGAGVDHREAEACFEPALGATGGLWRVYPDLPGMGRTAAPAAIDSADDVLDVLRRFADEVAGGDPVLLAGHSAGAYYAQGFAARWPERVLGLALVCPLLPGAREVPEHRAVVAADGLGDKDFRAYFVVQTPAMLERYQRFVAPAVPLADHAAMERIGQRWALTGTDGPAFGGPTLLVAGRQDSTVGYAAAADLAGRYPRATLAVVDGAGHALPHEKPELLACLLAEWVARATAGSFASGSS